MKKNYDDGKRYFIEACNLSFKELKKSVDISLPRTCPCIITANNKIMHNNRNRFTKTW